MKALLLTSSLLLLLVACSASIKEDDDEDDAVASSDDALRTLTNAEILGEIHYGETKGAIAYTRRPRFRAYWFMASAGDQIAVTATSSNAGATILVADDTFHDVAGNANATLTKTGKYFIALRDSEAKNATLSVTLNRTNVASAKVADVSVGPYGTCALLANTTNDVRCWGRRTNDFFSNNNFHNYADKTPANGQMPADHRFLPSHQFIGFDFAGTTPRSWRTAIEDSMNDYGNVLVYSESFFATLDGSSPISLLSSECAWFPGRIRCRSNHALVDFDFDGETFASGGVGSQRDFACAITPGKDLKCWGGQSYGRLGTGDNHSRGVGDPDQDSYADLTLLDPVNLGTNVKVASVALGDSHACALLDNGKVKCWGKGDKGQLGGTSRTNAGAAIADMGDALPFVALGGSAANTKAIGVYAFDNASCIATDDSRLTCFGDLPYPLNASMQFSKPVKKLVLAGRGATYSWSAPHACALLEDQSLRCWGSNQSGALGLPTAIASLEYDASLGASSLAPIEIP